MKREYTNYRTQHRSVPCALIARNATTSSPATSATAASATKTAARSSSNCNSFSLNLRRSGTSIPATTTATRREVTYLSISPRTDEPNSKSPRKKGD